MSEPSGRAGGFCAVVGAVLIASGLAAMADLPGPDAPATEVFSFFLDESGEVARPTALIAVGLVLATILFATLRAIYVARGRRVTAAVMLALFQLAIGLQAVSLALLGVLALRPEEADPATARALLDLSDLVAGISGAAFALGLLATAVAIRRSPGPLPVRFSEASLLAAAGCALWTVRLFTDADAFAPDSFLGSALGWLLLTAWILATGLWLATRRLEARLPEAATPAVAAEPAPAEPVPEPEAATEGEDAAEVDAKDEEDAEDKADDQGRGRDAAPSPPRAAPLSRSRSPRTASSAGPACGRRAGRRRSDPRARAGPRAGSRPCARCSPPSASRRDR